MALDILQWGDLWPIAFVKACCVYVSDVLDNWKGKVLKDYGLKFIESNSLKLLEGRLGLLDEGVCYPGQWG
jgi:hypothetical protein